jgi:hypothetical protein
MTHSSNNTLFRIIKNIFPIAMIVMISSFAAINPAVAMSKNIKINGYQSETQTEDASDADDCE